MRGGAAAVMYEPGSEYGQDRLEYVYALPLAQAEAFAEGVAEQLGLDPHYDSEDEERPKRYVTTLYFDTPNHQIAKACARGDNVKLRAREYYAPAGVSGVYREANLWLEVKRREGPRTNKLRCNILARELGDLLGGGTLRQGPLQAAVRRWGDAGERVIQEILGLMDRVDGPLQPDSIAHYRRRAWQDNGNVTRVTLDTELAFYDPPRKLVLDYGASLVEVIEYSEPLFEFEHAIVEAKIHGPTPRWLEALLERVEAIEHRAFSKFLMASRCVTAEL